MAPAGDTAAVRVTRAAKPLTLVRVIIEELDDPAWRIREPRPAETVNSGLGVTVTDTIAECSSTPFVPVRVALYDPVVEEVNLQDEEPVLPAGRKRLVGLQDIVRLELEGEDTKLMLPEKPPRLVKMMEEVEEEPAARSRDDGLALIVKSTMLTVTVTEWETEPLIPVTVTV